jgi:cytochrome c oxidase subunit 3
MSSDFGIIMAEISHNESQKSIDYTGAKFGMWLFLFTELILFGGMFLLYSVYRQVHTAEFHEAANEMSLFFGAANTVILLTSSLTMALSISAIKRGSKVHSMLFQAVTVILGIAFLGNKVIEWREHILHGFYPDSPQLLAMSHGKILFFGLYYVMTGIHGLHVLIGISIICFVLILTKLDRVSSMDYIKLENTGLFWHLVDIIWIYLFPLFYLIK